MIHMTHTALTDELFVTRWRTMLFFSGFHDILILVKHQTLLGFLRYNNECYYMYYVNLKICVKSMLITVNVSHDKDEIIPLTREDLSFAIPPYYFWFEL